MHHFQEGDKANRGLPSGELDRPLEDSNRLTDASSNSTHGYISVHFIISTHGQTVVQMYSEIDECYHGQVAIKNN